MLQHIHEFERFLRRAYACRILWQLIESIGICSAIASISGILLGMLLLARGESALPIVTGLLTLSVPAGVMLGWIRRPTLIATAVEIDRQLGLDDLLGSAMSTRGSLDAWAHTLRSIADGRMHNRSVNVLVLRRLGVRAWGGIGLAAAVVMAIGLLGSDPIRSTANEQQNAARPSPADISKGDDRSNDFSPKDAARAQQDHSGAAASDASSEMTGEQSTDVRNALIPQDALANASSNHSDSTGAVASKTQQERSRLNETVSSPASGDSMSSDAARATDGSQSTQNHMEATDQQSQPNNTLAGDRATASYPLPPWRGIGWTHDTDVAIQKVRDGSVPSCYGDLVRGYFSRD